MELPDNVEESVINDFDKIVDEAQNIIELHVKSQDTTITPEYKQAILIYAIDLTMNKLDEVIDKLNENMERIKEIAYAVNLNHDLSRIKEDLLLDGLRQITDNVPTMENFIHSISKNDLIKRYPALFDENGALEHLLTDDQVTGKLN